jgi:hypothetical protein
MRWRLVVTWVWAAAIASCLSGFGSSAAAAAGCPNETFRSGLSSALPDCRAYELVSPADTNGRFVGPLNTFGLPAAFQVLPNEISSPSRDSIVFLAYQAALPEVKSATGVADVYEAGREAGGWLTARRLSPSGPQTLYALPGGVSPDHLYSIEVPAGGSSDPLTVEGNATVYLGNPDDSFELVGLGSLGSEPYAQARYVGEGGAHIIFSTGSHFSPTAFHQSVWCYGNPQCKVLKLEPNAPPTGTGAVYDRSADGPTRVVSLLPGNIKPSAGEEAYWKGTSKDGSATVFEINDSLYVRLVEAEETKAVASGSPIFAGLSDNGSYLFYVVPSGSGEAGVIHRFDTATGADVEVNPADEGLIVNVSGDGSHVYFVSKAQLDGGEGSAGQPNLYLWNGGSSEYIRTVATSDLERTSGELNGFPALTHWTGWVTNRPQNFAEQGPGNDSSRITPDGSVLVFESKAQLTAYDNASHTEIYRYDDKDNSLLCVSCNPRIEPASSDARLQELSAANAPTIIHNVTDDGDQVFFESEEALVEADIDGVNDVYQWKREEGSASLSLISSGQSGAYLKPEGQPFPPPNLLLSVTPDGEDVTFLSEDALVPGAPEGGAMQIYDARVNGGFPAPAQPPVCLKEDCWPTSTGVAPSLAGPASEATQGVGNVKPRKHRRHRRCARHRRHPRCARHGGGKSRASAAPGAKGGRTQEKSAAPVAEDVAASAAGTAGDESMTAAPAMTSVGPFDGYGIEAVEAEVSTPAAGMHPDFTTKISLNHTVSGSGEPQEPARTEEVTVSIPPGLLGNPNAIPQCSTGELVALNCPVKSQVGVAKVLATLVSGEFTEPIYNLRPPHPNEEVARFGFIAAFFPVFIDVKVRTASDYGATATVYGASGLASLVSARTTLWANPADPSHDKQRLTPVEALNCNSGTACKVGGSRPSGLPPTVFMTNPSACQPMEVGFSARSYQLPGQIFSATSPVKPLGATSDCSGLPFAPSFSAEPTSRAAGGRTGLKTTLHLPQQSTEAVSSPATSTMREARVTLPAGMQVAPGAANWIGTCSAEQVGYHREVNASCPDSAKLGTATIASPLLPEPIHGWVYQRTPEPGRQFGLWLVSDELGMHVKVPGSLEPDPASGRLTAVFSDLPQVPVEGLALEIWGGERAPLENPDACGTYATDYSFSPHSQDPAVSGQSQMTIDQGCDRPFSPALHAGVSKPLAGHFSPLIVDLAQGAGEQALRGFELKLPDGELAKLKGVPLCPEAGAAAGACPPESRIGHLIAAAGAGADPLWVPQPGRAEPQIYLAGPYRGSPFSIVSIVPAQAGPFDLGNVVVRSGLGVERETGRALVAADPLPRFFEGVGLTYRRLHAVIDRPGFALNPTDCREMQTSSDIVSTLGAVAHPASRFQVDGCRALKFEPRLSLRLSGGTERGEFPALTAVLRPRRGNANLARTSVGLPHSEFLEQGHIGTICTRKRFAVDDCPKASVYGSAIAWTPLLAKPLRGPVYLRSSDNPLPDLVVDLRGQLEVAVSARIDTKRGGIRTTFEQVPDAPISRFVLRMRGGAKGLLVNSTDICRRPHRATVRMRGQNGRKLAGRPVLQSGCAHRKP